MVSSTSIRKRLGAEGVTSSYIRHVLLLTHHVRDVYFALHQSAAGADCTLSHPPDISCPQPRTYVTECSGSTPDLISTIVFRSFRVNVRKGFLCFSYLSRA